MRNWAKNTSRAALVAAGAVAVGASFGTTGAVANADMRTSGNFSILGGNQVYLPISIPVEISGNSVAVLGASQAFSKGGAEVENARHGGHGHGGKGGMETSGNFSIGGGNQVKAPISIPINVCGNSVAVLGLSQAFCKGGAEVEFDGGKGGHHHGKDYGYRASSTDRWDGGYGHGHGHGGKGGMETSGNFSILGGNQVYAPISAPINVCGNSVAVLGMSRAHCKGGASVERSGHKPDMKTSGNFSILGGNQVYAPISIPINVCGNSVAVLGLSQASCKGGASVGDGDDHELPPTLRKGSAAKAAPGPEQITGEVTTTLNSVTKGAVARVAEPAAQPVANQRAAKPAKPAKRIRVGETVRNLVSTLKKTAPVTDAANVQPGEVGPRLPLDEMPVEVNSPTMN